MPVPRQPYGPGSSQRPGCELDDVAAGEGDEVTAVADHDGVGVQRAAQLAVDAHGMDRVGLGLEQVGLTRRAWRSRCRAAAPSTRGARRRRPRRLRPATVSAAARSPPMLRRPARTCVATPSRVVRDVDDLGLAEAAVAQPEVQRRADDHDDVGALERRAARELDRRSWSGGRHPRPMPLSSTGRVQRLGELAQRLPGAAEPHVGTADEDRALGRRAAAAAAAATASRSTSIGSGGCHAGTVSSSAGVKITSIGTSTKVGPRCAVPACRSASSVRARPISGAFGGHGVLRQRRDDLCDTVAAKDPERRADRLRRGRRGAARGRRDASLVRARQRAGGPRRRGRRPV